MKVTTFMITHAWFMVNLCAKLDLNIVLDTKSGFGSVLFTFANSAFVLLNINLIQKKKYYWKVYDVHFLKYPIII